MDVKDYDKHANSRNQARWYGSVVRQIRMLNAPWQKRLNGSAAHVHAATRCAFSVCINMHTSSRKMRVLGQFTMHMVECIQLYSIIYKPTTRMVGIPSSSVIFRVPTTCVVQT